MADPSIQRFRRVMSVALAHLEERREEINDLNVFPVADGDTGDNMALTMRAVLAELERLEAESEGDPKRPEIVATVARAAMMGARGNSGVILSQIVRGAAEELASPPGRLIDPRLIAAALANAERAAYASIRNPVEGTMLTVAREMAAAVAKKLAHWEQHELSPEASDAGAERAPGRRCSRRRSRPRETRSATRPSSSTCLPRPGWWTRARWASP